MPLTIEKSWALRKLKSLVAVAGLHRASLFELLNLLSGERHRNNLGKGKVPCCGHRFFRSVLVH